MKTTFVEIDEWIISDNKAITPVQSYYINTDHIISISWYGEENSQIYLSNNYNFLTKGNPESVWERIDEEVDRQIKFLYQRRDDD
jgi:hypothetical protein